MKSKADQASVSVFMGFNKNVSKYVSKTLAYAESHPGTNATFLHNNNYDEAGLNECFERNSEGMLKNMGKKSNVRTCFRLLTMQSNTNSTIA